MSCEELFGPTVGVTRAESIDDAIRLANDSRFGLSAAVFTQDIDKAIRFAREVDSGNYYWHRLALRPPTAALRTAAWARKGSRDEEMTETKMIVIH